MSIIEDKYTVVLHRASAALLTENQFGSYFVETDPDFGPCIKCVSIDPSGPFLSLCALLSEEVTADVQIPHAYVLYILGGDFKQIGFKLGKRNEDPPIA